MFNLFVEKNSVGCLIDRGKIERGANGFLGEVGHMIILPTIAREDVSAAATVASKIWLVLIIFGYSKRNRRRMRTMISFSPGY